MLRKAQRLVLIGGVFCIVGAAGMWYRGPSLARILDLLVGPTPNLERELAQLVLAGLAFAVGELAVLLGVRALGRGHALSGFGRSAVVAAGLASAVGGGALAAGLWRVHGTFAEIAQTHDAPQAADVQVGIGRGSNMIHLGLGITLLGQWPLLFALLGSFWRESPPYQLRFDARVALPCVAMAAAMGFVVMLILAQFAAAQSAALAAAPGKPFYVALEMAKVLRYGMIGGICLVAGGITVALAGLAQPWAKSGDAG